MAGAPKKKEENLHSQQVAVRLTKSVYEDLKKVCDYEGESIADMIRGCIEKKIKKFKKILDKFRNNGIQ